jgi:hypothetical protein
MQGAIPTISFCIKQAETHKQLPTALIGTNIEIFIVSLGERKEQLSRLFPIKNVKHQTWE